MSNSKRLLARNFTAAQSIEQFYSGGKVDHFDGTLLTPCNAKVKFIDQKSGLISGSIETDTDDLTVTCLVVVESSAAIVIATSDLLLRQYSLSTKQLLKKWRSFHTAPIQYMCTLNELVISSSADRTCKVWDIQKSFCTHTLKSNSDAILSSATVVQMSGNLYAHTEGTPTLICGFNDGSLMVWNLSLCGKEGLVCRLDQIHSSSVTQIIIQNNRLLTCSKDQTVSLLNQPWSQSKAKVVPVFHVINCMVTSITQLHVDSVKDLSRSHVDDLVWLGSEDGLLLLLDTALCKVMLKLNLDNCSPVLHIVACYNTKSYWIATADLVLRCLDGASGKIVGQLVGCNQVIQDVALLGRTENVMVVATNSAHVALYNRTTQACALIQGHSSDTSVLCLDVANWNRDVFATCAKDNTVRLWCGTCAEGETPKATSIAIATGHSSAVTAIKFSRLKPKFIVSVSNDRTLKIWGLNKKLSKQQYEAKQEEEVLCTMSTVVVSDKDITCVDVAPNDILVATGSMDKQVALWKVSENGQLTGAGKLGHPRGVWDVRFSPADQVIASACGDGRLRIFALSDLSCVKTFECHDCAALKVRFLPSGLQLVSSDGGGILKLWDMRNTECVKSIPAHNDQKVWALTVSEDGKHIISGGEDCRVVVWNDVTESEQLEAEDKLANEIKHEQKLSNLVHNKKYSEALRLAVDLARPYNALNMVKELVHGVDGNRDKELIDAIHSMKQDQVVTLLEYVAQWNTNTRNAHLAQRVLRVILMKYTPQTLLQMPNIASVVEALLPYTERHFERLTRLEQQAAFINYTWIAMRLTGDETLSVDKA